MARTYSPINLLYDLKYKADGLISAIDMMPIQLFIDQKENSKEKTIDIKFQQNGEIESIRTQKGKPDKVLRFTPENPTLDPFAAAFLARGLNWKEGESKIFDTFNGKTRYLITLTAEGKEEIKIRGEKKLCWVISPVVRKLNSGEQQHKLRKAKIYVTDDKAREVVKIVSEVFIGAVTTKLIDYKAATTPEPIRMAQLKSRPILK